MTDDVIPRDAIDDLPSIEDATLEAGRPGGVRTELVGARPLAPRRPRRNPIRGLRSGVAQIVAVGLKELRGRVRGRRAFVVLTFYLLFLGLFAWAWELVAERAYVQNAALQGGSAAFASSLVGQEVFGALVIVETLLVVFLAPAFTSGAISLEREKQTLDMLAATPISSLAIVVGKLVSALAYVFLLIAASIPLTAIVFVFGGVGQPAQRHAGGLQQQQYEAMLSGEGRRGVQQFDDAAIGLGALGLFISAIMQRTQGATVVTFFMVLFLTLGTMFGVLFWNTMSGVGSGGFVTASSGVGPIKGRAPEAFLWFNPFAAQYDVICGASDGSGGWCSRLNTITNGAISVGSNAGRLVVPTTVDPNFGAKGPPPDFNGGVVGGGGRLGLDPQPFGIRRDTFWPRSLQAWIVLSIVLILASIQLVSPTRRWRLFRRPSRRFA